MRTQNMYCRIIFYFIGLLFILTSCSKSSDEITLGGEATLTLNLDGLEYENDKNLFASTSPSEGKQIPIHIQYADKDFHIESQLIPVGVHETSTLKNGVKKNSSAIIRELEDKIKYKLLVYKENGELVTSKDYVYGETSSNGAISLNTYNTYSFIVVSSRSKTSLPNVKNINKLSTATVNEANKDLLYWCKKGVKLTKGQNYLSARLKPKFSEVTTTIKMDQSMTGNITAISNVMLNPVVQDVNLKLEDGSLVSGPVTAEGKAINFPSLSAGQRTIISLPTTVTFDHTTKANLTLGSLTVDGETKKNITVSGLTIEPGYRYNLVLTLKTCTEAVSGLNGFNWHYDEVTKTEWWVSYKGIDFLDPKTNKTTFKKNGEVISFEFEEKGADYGFVYDILELDNAFNLEVNGTPLVGNSVTSGEIQFQNNATSSTQNIEFADGSQYQSELPSIWDLKGTETKPIVRVVIGRNGDVQMYGSKESKGELFPLRLKNNGKFNTVKWNGGNATNKIKATTRVEGKTVMKSYGSGRRKIPCN